MFVTMVIWRKSSIEVLTNIKPLCGASGGITSIPYHTTYRNKDIQKQTKVHAFYVFFLFFNYIYISNTTTITKNRYMAFTLSTQSVH